MAGIAAATALAVLLPDAAGAATEYFFRSRPAVIESPAKPSLTLGSSALPAAKVGERWSFDFGSLAAATDVGAGTPAWSLSGAPAWLSIDPALGVAQGVPTATGTPAFTVTVSGYGMTASSRYEIPVGAGAPAITLSASTLSGFSVTPTQAPSQTLTVSNTGHGPTATAATPTLTGAFALVSTTCTASLQAGGNCQVVVRGIASANGPLSGQVRLAGHGATVSLAGSAAGFDPRLTVASHSLGGFTATPSGGTTQAVAVTNSGYGVSEVPTPSASGNFRVASHNCVSGLGPGASCSVTVQAVMPAANGPLSGSLTIPGLSQAVTLSGTASGGCNPAAETCGGPVSIGRLNGVERFGYVYGGAGAFKGAKLYPEASGVCPAGFSIPNRATIAALAPGVAAAVSATGTPDWHLFWVTDTASGTGSRQMFSAASASSLQWGTSTENTYWRVFCVK